MRVEWSARFGGESGLILISDAEEFQSWTGAVYDDDYQLDPDCDYARAEAAAFPDDDEVDAAPVGAGIVWQMDGAGVAEVGVVDDGLLILRSWGDEAAARDFAVGAVAGPPMGEFDTASGQVTLVWAPVPANETTRRGDQLDTVGMLNIGTVVPLRPGRYTAVCGSHDNGRWIRLVRIVD